MFRRLWILGQMDAEQLRSFDSAHIDKCISHCNEPSFLRQWNSTRFDASNNNSNKIAFAIAQCRWLYFKFQPLLPSSGDNQNIGYVNDQKELELILEAMKKLLFDCRTEDHRQTNAEIALDIECQRDLGYNPYQIRGMGTSELLEILNRGELIM